MAEHFTRACLITNPKSGRGGVDLTEALTVLQANGWDVTVRQKLKGGMAEDLAREAAKQGYNVVVDCGGDGQLDVCLITATTPLAELRQLVSLALRGRTVPATTEVYRAASIVVRSPVVFPLETDGGVIDLDEDDLTPDGVVYTFRPMAQGISVLVPRTYQGDLFEPATLWTRTPLAPLKPVAHPDALDSGDSAHLAARLRKRAKWFKQRYQVIAVGGDTFTAAREKDGKVVKVVVTPETTLKEPRGGRKRPLWGGLTALSAEDIVRIKGIKGAAKGLMIASRVRREIPAALRALQAG